MTGWSRDRPGSARADSGDLGLRRREIRRGCGPVEILIERFEHAGGFLAARHAQVQAPFGARKQCVGIVLAVVTALAAVLLRHCRHHAPPQRLPFGEPHALGQLQRLIVPRRAVILFGRLRRGARHECGRFFRGQRRDAAVHDCAVGRNQSGEKAAQPLALLGCERRAARDQLERRRRKVLGHSAASASHSERRAATSCRRAKREEGLVRPGAMRQIRPEQALDRSRRILGSHVAVKLARQAGVRTKTAADMHVIAFHRVAIIGNRDPRAEQPDVADVVLRARMMAASEMDIHRAVDLDACLAPAGDVLGMLLGVRGREAAAAVAGARHQPGTDRRRGD